MMRAGDGAAVTRRRLLRERLGATEMAIRCVHPATFARLEREALAMGLRNAVIGAPVRSVVPCGPEGRGRARRRLASLTRHSRVSACGAAWWSSSAR